MNPKLFKSAEFNQRRYHNFATLLIVPLFLLVVFLILFSLFAETEVSVTSKGEIAPVKVIASIQSTSNNPITKNNLINNQPISKGELILQYSEVMENSQKQSLESQLNPLYRQRRALETLKSSLIQGKNLFTDEEDEFGYINTFNNFITQSQDIELSISKTNFEIDNQTNLSNNTTNAIDAQINNIQKQILEYEELSQAITNNTSNLSKDNPHQATLNKYLTQFHQHPQTNLSDQYLSQINQSISSLESSVANLIIQRAGTGSVSTYDNSFSTKVEVLRTQFLQTASQQLITINNQITDLEAQLKQAEVRLKNNSIRSPTTGIIHLNEEFEGKSLIPTGSEIAQIYPNITDTKEVLIAYYVTSDYISSLKKHQKVRFSLEKIGNHNITLTGNIQSIDKTATRTKEGNFFKVIALAKISEKYIDAIQYGMQGRVTSVIEKKTFFNYYKDKILNGF